MQGNLQRRTCLRISITSHPFPLVLKNIFVNESSKWESFPVGMQIKNIWFWNHHPTFPEWVSITQPGETRDGKTSLRTHRSLLSVTLNELVNTVDEPGNRIIWSWHRKMLLGQLLLIAASSCHMGAQARSGDARWMCPHAKHPGDHECKRQLFPEWKSLSSRKEDMVQCFCSHYISFNDDSRPPWFLYLAHF